MLKSLFCLSLFATAAYSQAVQIGLPTKGDQLAAGSNQTIQIQRPDTLTGSDEIAVVIGIQQCPNGTCTSPDASMGTVLYQGGFDPEFHGPQAPYQNFTVKIPDGLSGPALIGVAHLSLVGASTYPLIEFLNQTVAIV
ncbi:hypothetical protein POJ06DRAFT_298125 [Lipomyces tetrasporus]|uniref:Uncharacterized protein n=1 Tax=Lipomyces tetrasporus TaxID=54092 RepID=A0AAD7QYD4_9ASCO|nr:uncharacterized protein POJ06DRAFT_298125 [Lipomyces tetrasporus]KAJ8103650.1 hypothetical protein POJ06DRAFT_298125 [Lipomyces tetrasporus]